MAAYHASLYDCGHINIDISCRALHNKGETMTNETSLYTACSRKEEIKIIKRAARSLEPTLTNGRDEYFRECC